LCEQKGQLLLLEAARILSEQGVAFEIVLAGDGEMREQIESLITQYGLQAQVRITGWISSEQVRAEILAARALVLPSFAEGLPVVIMEAMALRRPVLTTYVAGIPELVRQGENGWLFPAGAVNELATALADCLAQPVEVLQRMGEAAYQRVLERHDIDTEAAKLAELFKAQA
jgi:glycosyltransferase involved in cell wall biosynthesis